MTMRVAAAKDLCKRHPVRQVCRLLGVNRSTLYHARAPKRDLEPLTRLVCALRVTFPQAGVPYMYELLRRHQVACSRREVRQMYVNLGILGKRPARRPRTTNSRHAHPTYPDLVKGVEINRPDQVWVTDVTYIRVSSRWAYLALIEDAYTRRIVGWAISKSNNILFCLEALDGALLTGTPEVHHSDQDNCYASPRYIERLLRVGAAVSMTATASPWDNGYAERLNRTVKHEEILLSDYQSMHEASQAIASWVELYNHGRPHSALNYCTPMEFYEMHQAGPNADERSP